MNLTNQQIITAFYSAFQKKDYQTMQNCYADEALFSDPVFQNLNAIQVRNMWEMLCKSGKDLKLEYSNISTNDNHGEADWIATYTFSKTGRKVVNKIHASFEFDNGKILKHHDSFNFYLWTRQAMGLSGFLLGWSTIFQNKVQKNALKSLNNFSEKNNKIP